MKSVPEARQQREERIEILAAAVLKDLGDNWVYAFSRIAEIPSRLSLRGV
ncbi:hypothetical protein RGQ15_19355 [Paracoccus sp. MBLB3053]|uniref:Uncharacterized protein n=1 Tax=Paracoccus aurantius TaxID=3073814 RepID=A0ABU2HYZ5_9RHOB|nr:hypothetical protein [Paracoccus sp. MBLB3053]MDS9469725.1 hypothetical protein [Paracoccus sp. MBLB3053]